MTYSKRYLLFLIAVSFVVFSTSPTILAALTAPEPEAPDTLSIVRLKITGEEYIEIQNNSEEDIDDLSEYALKAYNNVSDTAPNATVSSQAFPALKLEQGARLLISSTIRPTCGASLSGKLSISLVDGGGTLQIVRVSDRTNTFEPTIIDSVNWSSSTNGMISMVPSFSKSPLTTYYRYGLEDGSYAWQKSNQDSENACRLIVLATATSPVVPVDIVPPEQQDVDDTFTVGLEDVIDLDTEELVSGIERNSGLLAIEITEILPNPVGSGNDTAGEYIELYNPNSTIFDISGYKLRSGLSTLRYYTFPSGSTVAAGSYLVAYTQETGLSLSNTVGQVTLMAPDETLLSMTGVYRTAKDGQSWLRHSGVWQWSVTPTPGAANVATVPTSIQKKTTNKVSTSKKSLKPKMPKAPKAPKTKKAKKPKAEKPAKLQTIPTAATVESRPIQSRVIAIIALIALLYGAYEYRGDLANKYQQCRRHVSSWRPRRRSAGRR